MSILYLEQNTQPWLEWRKGLYTASDASVVMGAQGKWYKVKGLQHWLDIRLGRVEEPVREAYVNGIMAKGSAIEKQVRNHINRVQGWNLEPVCLEYGRYGASLDGYDGEIKLILEVKAPSHANSRVWLDVLDGLVNQHVYWQLVHQMACAPPDTKGTLYVVHHQKTGDERALSLSREQLMADWPALKQRWEYCHEVLTQKGAS